MTKNGSPGVAALKVLSNGNVVFLSSLPHQHESICKQKDKKTQLDL